MNDGISNTPFPLCCVVVIGCGWARGRHASAFRDIGCEVRWVVDRQFDRAEELATIFYVKSLSLQRLMKPTR